MSSGSGTGAASRDYRGPHADLQIQVGPLNSLLTGRARTTATVAGHPATISWSTGFEQDIAILWNVGNRQLELYQLSNYDHGHPALTVAELLRIATSVR